jgi:uncharacterized protein YqeY
MKQRDAERIATLRLAISALNYRKIERSAELSDAEQEEVLRKQLKQREDSIAQYRRGKRDDLADKEAREREILKQYLPAELSPQDLREAVRGILRPLGAGAQFGDAMKLVMAELKDRASGRAIQEAVREHLGARNVS